MFELRRACFAVALALTVAACGDEVPIVVSMDPPDAAARARDAASPPVDASNDAPLVDASNDAPLAEDAGADARAEDAGGDVTSPAEDAAPDAPAIDGGSDAAPTLSITATALDGRRGVAYDAVFAVTGSSSPIAQWSIASGTLPAGLVFAGGAVAQAHLGGVPTQEGTFGFTVSAQTTAGETAQTPVVVTIQPSPVRLTSAPLPSATVGEAYTAGIDAIAVGPVTWRVADGELPPGLALVPSATKPHVDLVGTPSFAAPFFFTLEASDVDGPAQASFSMEVVQSLTFQVAAKLLPDGREAIPYAAEVHARHAPAGAITWWVADGALPAGLQLAASQDGVLHITGTPLHAGLATFTLGAKVGAATASGPFRILVRPAGAWALLGIATSTESGSPYDVRLQDVTGGSPGASALVASGVPSVYDVAFAPSLRGVTFVADSGQPGRTLYFVDLRGGIAKAVNLGPTPSNSFATVAWSPDGTHFFVRVEPSTGEYGFFLGTLPAQGPPQLVSLGGGPFSYPAEWAPDGSRVAILSLDGTSITVADTNAAATTYDLSSAGAAYRFDSIQWGPEGQRLFVSGWNGTTGSARMFALPLDAGATPFPVTASATSFNPNLTTPAPDGSALLLTDDWSSGFGGARVLDLSGDLHLPPDLGVPPSTTSPQQTLIGWLPTSDRVDLLGSSSLRVLAGVTNVPHEESRVDVGAYATSFGWRAWSPDATNAVVFGDRAIGEESFATNSSRLIAPDVNVRPTPVQIDATTPGVLYQTSTGYFALNLADATAQPFRVDGNLPCGPDVAGAPGIAVCAGIGTGVWVMKLHATGSVTATKLLDVPSFVFTYMSP